MTIDGGDETRHFFQTVVPMAVQWSAAAGAGLAARQTGTGKYARQMSSL
jgi:hypothetical protein